MRTIADRLAQQDAPTVRAPRLRDTCIFQGVIQFRADGRDFSCVRDGRGARKCTIQVSIKRGDAYVYDCTIIALPTPDAIYAAWLDAQPDFDD